MSIYLRKQTDLKVSVRMDGDNPIVELDPAGDLSIRTLLGPQMGRAQSALAKQDWSGLYDLAPEIVSGVSDYSSLDPMVVFLLIARAIQESKIKDDDVKKS